MKLDDFNSKFNSTKVSKVLEDKFGTKVDLTKLNLTQLKSLKTRVTESHNRMVKSMPFNSGHRNPEYLEQVALLEAIELRINEVDQTNPTNAKSIAKNQIQKHYGKGNITYTKSSNGGHHIQHEDDFGDMHSHQYDPTTGKVDFKNVGKASYYDESEESMAEGAKPVADLDTLIDKIDAYLRQNQPSARYKSVDDDENTKTLYWVTQETDERGSQKAADLIAKILKKNGYAGWTVKVVRRDDFRGPKSPWKVSGGNGMDEAIVGKPEKKHVGGAGMGGGYSDAEDEATTKHQMGSHQYIATTSIDGDGDRYHTIEKIVNGEPVRVYYEMADMGGPKINKEPMVAKKIMADHIKATGHMFDYDEEDDMYETAPKGWEGTVKAMKKHKEIDNPWALAHYMKNKGYKSHVDETKDEDNEEEKSPAFTGLSGAQTSALRMLVGSENISNAKNALKLAKQGKSVPANMMKGFAPIVDMLLDVLQGGSSYARRLQALDKQASNLGESRHLFEGETEKAQLIMAVKDMVDRVQGMVEDLSKMKVEDLVALTDKMRDEFGQEQATSFTSSANDILSTGIDSLTNARTELDNAVLTLTGQAPAEVPGAEMGAQPGADMSAQPGAEMPPAEPGSELPPPEGAETGSEDVGRELRESRVRMRKRILESSRFLGKLAK